jgi:hypothetical protein
MRLVTKAVLVAAIAVILPGTALAQSLTGTVRDASGGVLPGVTVEAASPALIERTRSTVSDGTGQYRIIDLQPGAYQVTFTLPGFSTVVREGVNLSGDVVVTINADMRVGGVTETITVTGETPTVDVQTSTVRQQVLTDDVIQALPASRGYGNLLAVVPSIQTTGADNVGGNPNMSFFTAMGGRSNEGTVQIDGMNVGSAFNGGGVAGFGYDMVTAQEVQLTVTGGLGEVDRGGPAFNMIPRTGGNTFSGTAFASYAGEWAQSDNLTPELEALGLAGVPGLIKSWDTNGALGGPIFQDRLWFFGNVRTFGNHTNRVNIGWNAAAGDPTRWDYEPDFTKSVRQAQNKKIGAIRLTAQATPRNKVGFYFDYQRQCDGSSYTSGGEWCRGRGDDWTALGNAGGFGSVSPESADGWDDREKIVQANWTSPATNQLLLEAGFSSFNSRWGGQVPGGQITDLIQVTQFTQSAVTQVPVAGFSYRGFGDSTTNDQQHNVWRASAAYVTGSHNFKVGYQAAYQVIHFEQLSGDSFMTYNFFGDPNDPAGFKQVNYRLPLYQSNRTRYDALYVQDQWTVDRLTLQGGLRYEHASSWGPAGENGIHTGHPYESFIPGFAYDRTQGVEGFNDWSPRFGAAYDLFGDGKTSLKMHWSHYLQSASNDGIYTSSNPSYTYQWNTSRTWFDSDGDHVVDCDPANPATQIGVDFCGPWSNQNFGQVFSSTTVDPALLSGTQNRPYDTQIGVSIQQEILPRLSVELGYNRRAWGNFQVVDNRAVGPEDYDIVTLTAPVDPRFPDGISGQPYSFYVIKEAKFGQEDNFQTYSDNYGSRTDYWHGVDLTVNARLQNSLTLQAGTNTGRGVRDLCEVEQRLPETVGGRIDACEVTENWLTTFRGLATYVIPKADVLVSAVFRSNPNTSPSGDPASTGASLGATIQVTSAEVQAAIGRPLPGGSNSRQVNLVLPNTLYGDRLNAMDMRFGKILRFGGTRFNIGVDLYNIFNANTATGYNQGYFVADPTTWLAPTGVLNPRFARFNVTIDY